MFVLVVTYFSEFSSFSLVIRRVWFVSVAFSFLNSDLKKSSFSLQDSCVIPSSRLQSLFQSVIWHQRELA